MKLNLKKCKDHTVSFLRDPPQEQFSLYYINTQSLEKVNRYKVLGVILQEDLKWNAHIDSTTLKASKRLHILRVLRNSGIPAQDLIPIYVSLIRSSYSRILLRGLEHIHPPLPF